MDGESVSYKSIVYEVGKIYQFAHDVEGMKLEILS